MWTIPGLVVGFLIKWVVACGSVDDFVGTRRSRLVGSAVLVALGATTARWADATHAGLLGVAATVGLAAVWLLALSVVDFVKELPAVAMQPLLSALLTLLAGILVTLPLLRYLGEHGL